MSGPSCRGSLRDYNAPVFTETSKKLPVPLYFIAAFFACLGAQSVPVIVSIGVQFVTMLVEKPYRYWPLVLLFQLLAMPVYLGLTYYLFATSFRLVRLDRRGLKDARIWFVFFAICLLLLMFAVYCMPHRTYGDWITILGHRVALQAKLDYYTLIATFLALVLGQYFILTRPNIKSLFGPNAASHAESVPAFAARQVE